MNDPQIRLEALKLSIAIENSREFPGPPNRVLEQAARFAEFIKSGRADNTQGGQF